jgi:hypothetical protein
MNRGKHRNRKKKHRQDYLPPNSITDTLRQEQNPTSMSDPREDALQKSKRPPSTVGEIVIAIFVAATVVIYIILTGVSIETLHVDQRARVGVPRFNIGPPQLTEIAPNVELLGNGEFENFGKTPATVDESGVSFEVRSTPVPENFDYEKRKPGRFILYPGEKGAKTNDASCTIKPEDFSEVKKSGEKRLYLHGIVQYHDEFGSYTTRWCFYWSGGTDPRLFSPCWEHNSAD